MSDFSSLAEGSLISQLTTGTTTSVTVQLKKINGVYSTVTWPTGAHEIMLVRQTEDGIYAERCPVASGTTQSNTTGVVTLGTLTRNCSMTDGTDTTGSAATITWPVNTKVYVPWSIRDADRTAFKNEAQTFSALQTVSAGLTASGTTAGITNTTMTTAQRDTWGATNGRQVYNSTTGQTNWVEGGAWVANAAGGTVADGSATVAGKFEEATVAEQEALTATGGTGARLIPAVANMTITTATSGKIPALNTAGKLDVAIGGTGVASPTSGALLVGAGTSAMTLIGPGSSGQVPLSNGTTIAMGAAPNYTKVVLLSGTSSTTLTNPTSITYFDTYTYTIPANDLVSGVAYEWEIAGTYAWAAGAINLTHTLGSTDLVTGGVTLGTPNATGRFCWKGRIYGTTTAGASVAVRSNWHLQGTNPTTFQVPDYAATAAIATNGTLALKFGAIFSSSDGANTITINAGVIRRLSTTAA